MPSLLRAPVIVFLVTAASVRAGAQSTSMFGTYELTQFGRSTMTGASVITHSLLVLAPKPLPKAILKALHGTKMIWEDPPKRERACTRVIPDSGATHMGRRTDWRILADSVEVVEWFDTDAGKTFLFKVDSAGLRGVALSTGWMPSPPSGRGSPMNLRDSIIGRRVGPPAPERCLGTIRDSFPRREPRGGG